MQRSLYQRVLAGGLIVLSLIFISLMPARWIGGGTSQISKEETLMYNTLLQATSSLPPSEDPDGDGIPNWEEKLRGTDPYTKNTSESSVLGRATTTFSQSNPSAPTVDKLSLAILNDPKNLTVALAKNNLMIASYYGNTDDQNTSEIKSISGGILDETLNSFSFSSHSESELNTITTKDPIFLKKFGNTVASSTTLLLLKHVMTSSDIEDLKIILSLDPSLSPQAGNRLSKKIKALDLFIKGLLSMKIPSDATTVHLNFINAVEAYKETLLAFMESEKDPVKTTYVLPKYSSVLEKMFSTYGAYGDYFTKRNVVFLPKDRAYVFTVGTQTP